MSADKAPAPPAPDAEQAAAPAPASGSRFRILSKVVMAMRRFQNSINPTYEFGKRASQTDAVEQVGPNSVYVQPTQAGGSRPTSGRPTSGRTSSGRTSSGRPTSGHHGHKGGLLFRPLPKVEQEVVN